MTQADQNKWNKLTALFPKNVATFLQPKVTDPVSLDEAEEDYAASLEGLPVVLVDRITHLDAQESVDVDTSPAWGGGESLFLARTQAQTLPNGSPMAPKG